MIIAGLNIFDFVNAIPAPAASASMLVATATASKHFKSRHFWVSSHSFFIASFIKFRPKSKNIVKIIHFENGSNLSTNDVSAKYPIIGIKP